MKVLISGGCGYVGSNIAKALKGHKVYIIDKIRRPIEGCEVITGDILNAAFVRKAFEGREIDVVFHCAGFGMSGEQNLPHFDALTEAINVKGTKNVIEAALKAKVKAFVYTSSTNVAFKGREIRQGNELEDSQGEFIDCYSR